MVQIESIMEQKWSINLDDGQERMQRGRVRWVVFRQAVEVCNSDVGRKLHQSFYQLLKTTGSSELAEK